MDFPIFQLNAHTINAQDLSVDITSDTLEVKEVNKVSVQWIWTGSSPVGTGHIQVSNNGTDWKTLSTNDTSVSGNTGNDMVNLPDIAYAYLRLLYAHTSGTGSLDAYVSGKRN